MSKNILYINPNGFICSAGNFILQTCSSHLNDPEINAHILFLNEGRMIDAANSCGVSTELIPYKWSYFNPFSFLTAAYKMRKLIKEKNIDIIHSAFPNSHILASVASFGLGRAKIWFQHGPVGGLLDFLAGFYPVEKLLFNSKYTQYMHNQDWTFFNPSKGQKVIRMGLPQLVEEDKSSSHQLREKHLEKGEEILLICVGRFFEAKGFETAINSLALMPKENLSLVKLLIIGSTKEEHERIYKNKLEFMVKKLNLEDKVEFLNHQNDVSPYLAAADIFLHTQKVPDGFGLAVAEAMQQRCLIIGSNIGGVHDILLDGITGFTYSPEDNNASEIITTILNTLLQSYREDPDEILAENILDNAEGLMQNQHSIAVMIEDLKEVYQKL